MQKTAALVVPGNLDSRTGGYIYDRHVVDGLRAKGWSVDVMSLDETFRDRPPQRSRRPKRCSRGCLPARSRWSTAWPSVRFRGSSSEHGSRLRIVALMHLPLAAAIGTEEEAAAQFAISRAAGVGSRGAVIVTVARHLAIW